MMISMTNLEKIVKSIGADRMQDLLVLIARSERCAAPYEDDCYACPFFELCMFSEMPTADIKKWLKSEVKDDG